MVILQGGKLTDVSSLVTGQLLHSTLVVESPLEEADLIFGIMDGGTSNSGTPSTLEIVIATCRYLEKVMDA